MSVSTASTTTPTTVPTTPPALATGATDCVANLAKGDRVQISSLAPALTTEQSILRARLEELGFLPGEHLRVVAVAFPSGDPLAVRLGNTTFALRRHEAEMICFNRPA